MKINRVQLRRLILREQKNILSENKNVQMLLGQLDGIAMSDTQKIELAMRSLKEITTIANMDPETLSTIEKAIEQLRQLSR